MNLGNKKTAIIILIGFLWGLIAILGWLNMFLPGMYLGVILIFLHVLLGAANKGRIKANFLFYPLAAWAILWILGFGLSAHFSAAFKGTLPPFTILGFHPSFAWTVLTYWLGGMATLTIGFILYQDQWLSEKDWAEFKEKLKNQKTQYTAH